MLTVGSILKQHKGFGPGFHYMRATLAILVVVWHVHYAYAGMTGGLNLEVTPVLWFLGYAVLVMFFALGGFLIAGSVTRLDLKDYAFNRALRIMPALAVEVVLSMLILGPLFTALPLSAYFGDPRTYLYATNVVGVVNYFLPGVFAHNPAPEVNNALWTIPFEYLGYAATAAYAWFGLTRRPRLLALLALVFIAIGFGLLAMGCAAPDQYMPSAAAEPIILTKIFSPALFLGRGARLMIAFTLGVAAYACRDRIAYDRRLFLAALLVCLIIAFAGPAPWLSQPMLGLVAAPAIVYVTLYVGVSDFPRVPLFWRGDYSYGIYLYGFPVQQSVRALFPETGPVTQFVLAIGPILLLAFLSWHFVEEPVLRARRRFSLLAQEKGLQSAQGARVEAPAAALGGQATG